MSESKGSREADQRVLNEIVNDSFEKGLAIVTAKYLEESEHKLPQPRYTCISIILVNAFLVPKTLQSIKLTMTVNIPFLP